MLRKEPLSFVLNFLAIDNMLDGMFSYDRLAEKHHSCLWKDMTFMLCIILKINFYSTQKVLCDNNTLCKSTNLKAHSKRLITILDKILVNYPFLIYTQFLANLNISNIYVFSPFQSLVYWCAFYIQQNFMFIH
jgi:hypothetical protein